MALDWLPIVPDLPRKAPRLAWRQWTTWRFPIVVPDILATATFFPSYPPTAVSRRLELRPAERSAFAGALTARAVSPLDWYQQRPDVGSLRAPQRLVRGLRPAGDPPAPGQATVVAAQGAWRAQLPDQWPPRRARMPEGLGTPRFVAPLVPIGTGGCVEWGPEGWTITQLAPEGWTTTSLLAEAFTATGLVGEDLC